MVRFFSLPQQLHSHINRNCLGLISMIVYIQKVKVSYSTLSVTTEKILSFDVFTSA